MIRAGIVIGFLLVAGICGVEPAQGHTISQSSSSWMVEGKTLRGVIKLPAREVTRLSPLMPEALTLDRLAGAHVENTIHAFAGTRTCDLSALTPLAAGAGFVRIEVVFECPKAPTALEMQLFEGLGPSHFHIARFSAAGDFVEHVFNADRQRHDIQGKRNRGGVPAYFLLGAEHILLGYDHLAFLAGLLLASLGLRPAVIAITGFTLGHAISIAGSSLGYVSAASAPVEAMIGLSVAIVAAEPIARGARIAPLVGLASVLLVAGVYLAGASGFTLIGALGLALFAGCYFLVAEDGRWAAWWRPSLTLMFGLVHGFGFAGMLAEAGLEPETMWASLLGFNLGVEAGQIVIAVLMGGLGIAALRLSPKDHETGKVVVRAVPAALLTGLGIYWFVSRSLL